jgi:predicted enzyme related to lactoylglutathione lyase
MEAVDVRGRFVWHQLLTRDVPGAKKFYPSLTGWKAQPWKLDPTYTVCHSGDVPTAGIMAMAPEFPAEVPAHWMPYIGTRDVDGIAEAAVHAGGYIVKQPSDMKGAGRYAVLADPQGAVFAVIDPENARAEQKGMPPAGQFSWHELATTDNEAAFAFYSNLFGWDALQRMDMGPLGVYLIFGWNGEQKGGIYIKPASQGAQATWLPYARVPDVDATAATVESIGGKLIQPPMDVPGGRITVVVDPSGAAFALHSIPDAPGAPAAVSSNTPKPKSATAKSQVTPAPARPRTKPNTTAKPKAKSKAKARTKSRAKTPIRPTKAKTATRKSSAGKSMSTTKTKPRAKTKGPVRAKAKKAARRKK